ncbi:hypothetical protein LTR53_013315 [Teratosphaeriaceae sp. CCFEE 6253]|nr:hypothetical protein LTR53_013315 [Teratosphaeriaceae sp. CCFEE 6253]
MDSSTTLGLFISHEEAVLHAQDGLCGDLDHVSECPITDCSAKKVMNISKADGSYCIVHAGVAEWDRTGPVKKESSVQQATAYSKTVLSEPTQNHSRVEEAPASVVTKNHAAVYIRTAEEKSKARRYLAVHGLLPRQGRQREVLNIAGEKEICETGIGTGTSVHSQRTKSLDTAVGVPWSDSVEDTVVGTVEDMEKQVAEAEWDMAEISDDEFEMLG